jgi:regulation of enolase protein 1 (concanavalin A-like superfamily)
MSEPTSEPTTELTLVPDAPPFSWLGSAADHSRQPGTLTVTAGAATDWFVDPSGAEPRSDGPLLLAPAGGPATLAATLTVGDGSLFDAATLFVFEGASVWGKLALERSGSGGLFVVSVVTDRVSDDANHEPVPSGTVRLRIASLGGGDYAFHVADGDGWRLLRHFRLPHANPRLGFGAQSPTGPGVTATFTAIEWTSRRLADLRDGS